MTDGKIDGRVTDTKYSRRVEKMKYVTHDLCSTSCEAKRLLTLLKFVQSVSKNLGNSYDMIR